MSSSWIMDAWESTGPCSVRLHATRAKTHRPGEARRRGGDLIIGDGLAAGKANKVRIVACMRKLLALLNGMARDGLTWDQLDVVRNLQKTQFIHDL